MEQNNHPESQSRHIPTPEEIARAEAEAVKAMQQGEGVPAPQAAPAAPQAPKQDWSDVPYVDDVPEPEPVQAAEEDGEDAPYEPSEMEKRIAAIPEDKWKLYQTLGGAATGLFAILILTLGSEDLGTWALVLAAVLALVAPRYLERWWGRKIPRARMAMLIAMAVALAGVFIFTGVRTGFRFFDK